MKRFVCLKCKIQHRVRRIPEYRVCHKCAGRKRSK